MILKIKTILQFIVIVLVSYSCDRTNGLEMLVSNTIVVDSTDTEDNIIKKAAHVVPTKNQYTALKDEFIAFIHFGPNTFTKMEWGSGFEDPQIFDLKNLNTDQWCESMKSAGMTKVIFTAKHHDGFCLWQTRYTKHGIMSSNFENGKGDVLKNLAASCKKYGLKLGVYLSPADLYQIENKDGLYGNESKYTERIIPRTVNNRPFKSKISFKFMVDDYNEYFLNQLFELLTEYGEIHEVWFDGAHPKRKGNQQYNYLAWKELINKLAPKAVIFGKQDIRWCGNEAGKSRDTEWNIIPYKDDPKLLNRFPDLTDESIGSREQLYKGKFLHYQFAEINTSIREGWFYRDENKQKVRSVDDIFDMYERSVGGNTVFLLNIPPNRKGEFSNKDVSVLKDVGKRINETYLKDLFSNANGPKAVLDNNENTNTLINDDNSIIINTPNFITVNRFVIQEAIQTHGERIEEHVLDVWLNNEWKEICKSTNVGYKRILRFSEVTSNKFRLRVLKSRLDPAISKITAHYYKPRPPQVEITRNSDGKINIDPKKNEFRWKTHGENISKNLFMNPEIRYTMDGSVPNKNSKLFKEPFYMESGIVNAIAFVNDEGGSIGSNLFGILKNNWKIIDVDSELLNFDVANAFYSNRNTYWLSKNALKNHISLDLGAVHELKGFQYIPQNIDSEGMIEKGKILLSEDGRTWKFLEEFQFGNLINEPTKRNHYFKKTIRTRYIKLIATVIAGDSKKASIAELNFLQH